jgi:FkbM family methyltransferase
MVHNFIYKKSWFDRLATFLRVRSRRKFVPLRIGFLNDLVSQEYEINGVYEPAQTGLTRHVLGQMDAPIFVDIGANVGLFAGEVADLCDHLVLIEPNTVAFELLKLNAEIIGFKDKATFHNFGIGSTSSPQILRFSSSNVGGGFVKVNNAYSEELLYRKCGGRSDEDRYIDCSVEIVQGRAFFKNLFHEFFNRQFFIKIDVEGYETLVLKELSRCIAPSFQGVVLFENLDRNFLLDSDYFPGCQFDALYFGDRKVDGVEFKSGFVRILSKIKPKLVRFSPLEYGDVGHVVLLFNFGG